jgi:hypothetical protein
MTTNEDEICSELERVWSGGAGECCSAGCVAAWSGPLWGGTMTGAGHEALHHMPGDGYRRPAAHVTGRQWWGAVRSDSLLESWMSSSLVAISCGSAVKTDPRSVFLESFLLHHLLLHARKDLLRSKCKQTTVHQNQTLAERDCMSQATPSAKKLQHLMQSSPIDRVSSSLTMPGNTKSPTY